MGLLPPAARPVSGRALLNGTDLLRLEPDALRKLRGDAVAMIAQDPMSSLNPSHRVGAQVVEAIRAHRHITASAARAEALALFRRVGIADPDRRLEPGRTSSQAACASA